MPVGGKKDTKRERSKTQCEIKLDSSELNNTENRLLQLARNQYETKQYGLALNTLSKAISLCQDGSHFLFLDLQSAIKLDMGKLVGARRDARNMIELAPYDPRVVYIQREMLHYTRADIRKTQGYLRLGKILIKDHEIEQACGLYLTGYKQCAANHPMRPLLMKLHQHLEGIVRAERAQKKRDPASILPPEILCFILLRIGVTNRLQLLRVSKKWKDIIMKTPVLWHDLDWFMPAVPPAFITHRYPESFLKSHFSQTESKISRNAIFKCLALGQYGTRVLKLDTKNYLIEELVLKEFHRLRRLEVLHLPHGIAFGERWVKIDGSSNSMSNLKHISLGNSLPLLALRRLLRNLKMLESIECNGIGSGKEHVIDNIYDSEPLPILPRLKRLWLDKSLIRGWHTRFGLHRVNVMSGVSEDDITDILQVTPNVEELSLKGNILNPGIDGCYTGLKCLSGLHRLKTLSLMTWTEGRNDYAQIIMRNLPKTIQALSLCEYKNARIDRVNNIRLRSAYELQPLSICPNLEYLTLENLLLTRDVCEFIQVNGSNILILDLYGCQCTSQDDNNISQVVASCNVSKLEGLHLDATVINDDELYSLSQSMTVLPNGSPLQSLTLSETAVTGVGVLSIISKTPQLKWLSVSHCPGIRPDTMDYLRKLNIILKSKNV